MFLFQTTCTQAQGYPFASRRARVSSIVFVTSLLFVCAISCRAQSAPSGSLPAADSPLPKTPVAALPQSSASLSGAIVDPTGVGVSGARITLLRQDGSPAQQTATAEDGSFSFPNISSGAFQLTIGAEGFSTQTFSGVLPEGENKVLPAIALALAPVVAEVHVGLSTIEIAQEQIREQEEQRVFGVVPNFYVTYIPNAAPLNPRQKFNLAWKTTMDPISFGLNAVTAGLEQATNEYAGYGQGAQGYAKRYGASYADFAIGTFIGGAILPSLLHQDPRYFYKGTGTKRSRLMYAIANSVICKGDNGHWQANYSGILGSVASGGISNLYYPPGERGASLIFENTLIGLGMNAGANILQEFVIRKLTPNLPNHAQANTNTQATP